MNSNELKSKLEKTLEYFKNELAQIRTGRANPSLVEDIQVDAYSSKMSIKELGSVSVLDNQNLIISPWDRGLVSAIAKSIRESDLKLNPVEESDRLRIPVPTLTEERRKEFTKVVTTKSEESKNAMRSIRQETMKEIEKDFSDKLIGEDDKFRQKDDVEKTVKEFVDKIDELSETKKEEIMTV